MLKFIIIGVCLFVLYKLFLGDKTNKKIKKEEQTRQQAQAGDMVKDPVCGAYVSTESEIRVRSGNEVHCFCSYDCRDKYIRRLEATDAGPEESDKDA